MNYVEARVYIESLEKRGWRLGLDRMEELLRRVGNPHHDQKFFHVAGTNGKGSVTAMVASVLSQAGYRVGAFYSPYVYDFRERIQVCGDYISEEDVARLTSELQSVSEGLAQTDFGGPTEFEFKTAMGFLHWQEQNCDYVALEVGLGGRLDATNVVTPIVSVVTEIGLDHQVYLGNTIEEIAREKAGIIKPGVPVVTGTRSSGAREVLREIAQSRGAPFYSVEEDAPLHELPHYQQRNAATAAKAIEVSGVTVSHDILWSALRSFRLPGRLEVYSDSPIVILDGAHNRQSMEALVAHLSEHYSRLKWRVVYSAATGHDPEQTLTPLKTLATRMYAAPMDHPRGIGADQLREHAPEVFASVHDAVAAALRDLRNGEAILVTGSFYLLAEAKAALSAVLARNPHG